MPMKVLTHFLDSQQVKYITINHSKAFTAQEIAESAHISAKAFAKCVIVNIDGNMAMVVLPGHIKVNFEALKAATQASRVELASEYEFQQRFPDCELGAMPPFGNLFKMRVFADQALTEQAKIAFNAGSHSQLIQMNFDDYQALVKPEIIQLEQKS